VVGFAQQELPLIIGRQLAGDWSQSSRYEWLVTNNLGGFACGTVALANTRRYHGMLVASLAPPVARTLLVAKVEVTATYHGRNFELFSNEFADGTVSPNGYRHVESFGVIEGIPTWEFALDDALLQQKIYMAPGANVTYLRLKLLRGCAAVGLKLRPLVTYRDFHQHLKGAPAFDVQDLDHGCQILAFDHACPYGLTISRGSFTFAADWYWNFWHRAEAERGLDAAEDLFCPGLFEAQLAPDEALHVTAATRTATPADGEEVFRTLRDEAKDLGTSLPRTTPPGIRNLALAAGQFIVRRQASATAAREPSLSIIAGYPWFSDWGRDTMIALPGLATALQRYEVSAEILRTYARYVDEGMLPNRFPDSGQAPEYNTADATLWMFQAVDDYLRARPDPELVRDLFPVMAAIIRAHQRGTRFGIGVDARDGLLRAGEAGTQLTWMDAKHGERVFTPRIGKPVEINALWLNALDVTLRLAARLRAGAEKNLCQGLLNQASASFSRFWNNERGCLFDVLDVEGGEHADASLRPNQIIAVALPVCALTPEQSRSVVDVCAAQLLTSYGLRSLAQTEPGYIGRYEGGPAERDAAYHMGTVWSWLLGPFARAHYRVYGDARLALSFLAPMQQHLSEACIGSVSEIFDGDAPHIARGCFAQAWGVAEILRSWLYLERRISAP
jgi:predicted glycogen debranching enzyme